MNRFVATAAIAAAALAAAQSAQARDLVSPSSDAPGIGLYHDDGRYEAAFPGGTTMNQEDSRRATRLYFVSPDRTGERSERQPMFSSSPGPDRYLDENGWVSNGR